MTTHTDREKIRFLCTFIVESFGERAGCSDNEDEEIEELFNLINNSDLNSSALHEHIDQYTY